jgi:hypothetical protein
LGIIDRPTWHLGHRKYDPQGKKGIVEIRRAAGALCLAILAFSCSGGLNTVVKAPNPVTASTALVADRGSVVFSDNFKDSAAGWNTKTYADLTASFTKSGYEVVARRFVDHEIGVPYAIPKDQLSVLVEATESTSSPVGSGLGTGCMRGLKDPTVHYDFVVQVGGTWEVAKHDLLAGAATQHNVLKKGTSPKAPGATSIVVELMCATLSDGVTTRLVAFVNGTQVADITDPVTSLPRFGWLGSLTVRGEDSGPTTVTATHFEERDLTL